MSDMSGAGLAQLVQEIKLASANIKTADDETRRQIRAIEESVNDLYRKVGRPGGEMMAADEVGERKSAIGLCQIHRSLVAEGDATTADFMPSSSEIQAAMLARRGLKQLFRAGHIDRVDPEFRKSLSSFSFGMLHVDAGNVDAGVIVFGRSDRPFRVDGFDHDFEPIYSLHDR